MKTAARMLFALVLPVALLMPLLGSHQVVLAWTDFFSNIWSNIWNSIASILHIQTPTVQQQFSGRLAQLEGNASSFTQFYLSNIGKYNVSADENWTVQITDQNSTSSPVIGTLTISWNASSRSISIMPGITNATFSPAFAVRVNHGSFMSLSNDVIHQNAFGAATDFATATATHGIEYSQIG